MKYWLGFRSLSALIRTAQQVGAAVAPLLVWKLPSTALWKRP